MHRFSTPRQVVPKWFPKWFLLGPAAAVVPGSLPYGNRNHCGWFPRVIPRTPTWPLDTPAREVNA